MHVYFTEIIEDLSTDLVIAGFLGALFALCCSSTAIYFIRKKLTNRKGKVEDVFKAVTSNNIPPVHNYVQFNN